MAIEQKFTDLPTVTNSALTDIICAVQGYVSPSVLGTSTQQTLAQVLSLVSSNLIASNAGDPNGSVAGTTYNLCWDTVNKTLWVCTSSGTTSTAVWERCILGITTPTASRIPAWNTNLNLAANNFLPGFLTTATAAGTTVFTVASANVQEFTGSTTQTVTLPVTSTLVAGQGFFIINNSSGIVTVNSSGGNLIQAMAAGTSLHVTCILTSGTTAASWQSSYAADAAGVTSITGTANQVIASSPTGDVTLSLPQSIATSSTPAFANVVDGYTTTATAAGTTTLTNTSNKQQYFTGVTTQTVVLPVTSTLATGWRYLIVNNSSGVVTVQSSGLNTLQAMAAGTSLLVTCVSTAGTGTASWNWQYLAPLASNSAYAIVNGGTGVTSVTTAPGANAWAGWDVNSNMSANSFIQGFATTVTAAGTTTLTVASKQTQEFTGSTTQTVVMPVTSTLVAGQSFFIINNSSGALTVNSSGSNLILTMAANTTAEIVCVLNSGTTAASWNASYVFDNGAGVASITGTANQIIASASTGAVTLSLATNVANSFSQINAQTFSNSGTYTPTANMKYCIIELVGGGGGGGGCVTGGGATYVASAGGGAGGYAKALYTAAQIGASQTVTIGAAGTAGASGANAGGTGGTTSVGALISSVGGTGGGSGSTSQYGQPGVGGNPTVSSGINMAALNGMPGTSGFGNGAGSVLSCGGNGGTSPFGGGGAGVQATSVGNAGNGYGSGGSGCSTIAGASAGSAGAPGYVLVTEYI